MIAWCATAIIVTNYYQEQTVKNAPRIRVSKPKTLTSLPPTKILFDSYKHDFGVIHEGQVVSHKYTFKNIGDNPLHILKVTAACGCTITDYSKQPILPGEHGTINVSFDSANKSGKIQYNALVYSNAEDQMFPISFTAVVE